jgi:hypothetical protein
MMQLLGIDPMVLMIVLLLIGLGASMVFIGQMKSRVDALENGMKRQQQIMTSFITDASRMIAAQGQGHTAGPDSAAMPQAMEAARTQFSHEEPREKISVPDTDADSESGSSDDGEESDLESSGSEGSDDESVANDEGVEPRVIELGSVPEHAHGDDVRVVEVEELEALPVQEEVRIVSLAGNEQVDAEPKQLSVADLMSHYAEEQAQERSSQGDESTDLTSLGDLDEDGETAQVEDDGASETGPGWSGNVKKMKVTQLRALAIERGVKSSEEVGGLKKQELVALLTAGN